LQDAEELTVEEFVAKVSKVLCKADHLTKSDIITKLSKLFADHMIPRDAISGAIYAVLTGSEGTVSPDSTCSDHQQFVQAALPLLFMTADCDRDFLVELMFAYMEGSQATRYICLPYVFLTECHCVYSLCAEKKDFICTFKVTSNW